ncbi:hypothetical protein [Uliginosibacterium sp. 31-12]|uniref:preprotein translocase subunit SecA n=1 Tax=Uliginosibacterium sp. 31-12 TaxID=3062781 RepID=UPI0026E3CC83|nr:hypothetical protein [Uliginosibacterium sp. 31-12]MDO6386943.1 hypothetical protein [Uliginosibacterium sp. 31-12]
MTSRSRPPVPGLLLGHYPERIERAHHPDLPWLRSLLADLPPFAHPRRRLLSERATRILQRSKRLRATPAAMPLAELARDGFASAAAEACCARVCLEIENTLGRSLRPAQVMAALCVLDGRLAELPTGEGKTLASALAACVAALAGVPVHAVTSNDYLAARDAAMLQPLAAALGLRVAAIDPAMKSETRRQAYAAHITFCSARELVFDYLRDRSRTHDRVLRGLCMAIVDEADSVFIDEAATPFILSESVDESTQQALYVQALRLAGQMKPGFDFRVDGRDQSVHFSDQGLALIEAETLGDIPLWGVPRYRQEMAELAIRALYILRRNVDYLVSEGKIHIIDANSGRRAEGRSWSRGLHQMVELKERCKPTQAARVIAQITFQRFFSRYHLLGGMSGTLLEARSELLEVYGLTVERIPVGRPSSLRLLPPVVCSHAGASQQKLLEEVLQMQAAGRPVLIGTDSVRESERISQLLRSAGLPHQVLNARQDTAEAALIGQAGQAGAITVTTNMAGRGTDILIDEAVARAGGLHVLSCQHNSARRIDRQLFGRAARLGQPGSARTLLSLEEGLLGRYLGTRWHKILQLFSSKLDDTMPLVVGKMLLKVTQWLAERRARNARQRLRVADTQQGGGQLFGTRRE